MMKRLREQMAMHEVAIELTQAAKELLVEKGYDPAMGARPLRRAIQRLIEDPLADFVLGRDLKPGATILVDRRAEPAEGESLVDIQVIDAVDEPVAVTVPPDEPEAPAEGEAPAGRRSNDQLARGRKTWRSSLRGLAADADVPPDAPRSGHGDTEPGALAGSFVVKKGSKTCASVSSSIRCRCRVSPTACCASRSGSRTQTTSGRPLRGLAAAGSVLAA